MGSYTKLLASSSILQGPPKLQPGAKAFDWSRKVWSHEQVLKLVEGA